MPCDLTMHDAIALLTANGFAVLQQQDRGPLAWQVRAVDNADKVLVHVTHEHGNTTVVTDEPMGRAVRLRVEAMLPAPAPRRTRSKKSKAQD